MLAVWGVMPSVVGWFSLALPFAWAAPIQALLFSRSTSWIVSCCGPSPQPGPTWRSARG